MSHDVLEETACELCGANNYFVLLKKTENRSWWIQKCAEDTRLNVDMEFSIVKCRGCGLVFVNPRLSAEMIADIYANYWKNDQPESLESYQYGGYVCRQLKKLTSGDKLLDFGCGWGRYLAEAEATGWDAIGIEVDDAKIEFCAENGLKAINGNLLDQPFTKGSFDAVIAEQVFEHLYQVGDYLDEIWRILKPGGVVYICVPNFGGMEATLRGANWNLIHPVSHVTYFTRTTLAKLFQIHGFEVLAPTYETRYPENKIKSAAYNLKTFFERSLNWHFAGLALYARKPEQASSLSSIAKDEHG